jgi:hypothetical protein
MDFDLDNALLADACGPARTCGAVKSHGCFGLENEPAKKRFFRPRGHDKPLKRLKTAKPSQGNPGLFPCYDLAGA